MLESKEVTVAGTINNNPLLAYADAMAPRSIVGELVKFSKGEYLIGETGEPLAEGTIVTANIDAMLVGWVRWSANKPIEHIMALVTDVRTLPKRADLGDTDQGMWEVDSNGKPRDPLQFTNYVPMMDEADNLLTFATSSRGGLSAVALLIRNYVTCRKKFPNDHLKVALGVDSYQHKNREYGRIKFPKFSVVGHTPKSAFNEALTAAGVVVDERVEPGPEPVVPTEIESNDSIPNFGEEPPPADLGDFR
jgi:hypothetical protein